MIYSYTAVELHKNCLAEYQAKQATLKGKELDDWMQELENDSSWVGGFEQKVALCRVVDIEEEMLLLVCTLRLTGLFNHRLTGLTGFSHCTGLCPCPVHCVLHEPV